MNSEIKLLLKNLVLLIVGSRYAEIVNRGENGRLSASEMEDAINDYPGVITIPPDTAYDTAYVYDIYDNNTEARKIEFDLWYDDEVSDLTLSVDVHKDEKGDFVITIDDIHVL
ncbi:hypothetical protein BFW38_02400 [Terasakiispira papahanaumokuakeensis]|uniref:DUF7668 domain-containing protein n=1 Tax=Terasakiispira papahanaumokuakeensis TaxID=197479 RepID=A0A1E2V6F8_9GAMM|nr:hypothetical protein [Terasakiispira papahanaumokuakeensis]ODC02567.1 hypothetical protein BFW38_02400 [Terasakiispira papahanaumokuakeensis]